MKLGALRCDHGEAKSNLTRSPPMSFHHDTPMADADGYESDSAASITECDAVEALLDEVGLEDAVDMLGGECDSNRDGHTRADQGVDSLEAHGLGDGM